MPPQLFWNIKEKREKKMKKVYNKPVIEEENLEIEDIIAASPVQIKTVAANVDSAGVQEGFKS